MVPLSSAIKSKTAHPADLSTPASRCCLVSYTPLLNSCGIPSPNQFDDEFKCEVIYVAGDGTGTEGAYMCLP